MNRGWIKLFRKISDNDLWTSEPFTRGQAWVDLLLLAQHKSGAIRKRGILIKLPIGCVGMSQLNLAARWKWSRGKVKRFLNELETGQQIVQQKSKLTTLISITNYTEHQQGDTTDGQQTDIKRTTDGHQTDIKRYSNKNDKNDKNDKKKKYGEFKNVLLTASEHDKLIEKFNGTTEEKIYNISEYMARTGKSYKSHYLTILKWNRDEGKNNQDGGTPKGLTGVVI